MTVPLPEPDLPPRPASDEWTYSAEAVRAYGAACAVAERADAHRLLVQAAANVLTLRTWGEPMNVASSERLDDAARKLAIAVREQADAIRALKEQG